MSCDVYLVIADREARLVRLDRWLGRRATYERVVELLGPSTPQGASEEAWVGVTADLALLVAESSYVDGPTVAEVRALAARFPPDRLSWSIRADW